MKLNRNYYFSFLFFSVFFLLVHCQCPSNTCQTKCPFSDICSCDTINDRLSVSCGICNGSPTLTQFPVFTYYNGLPIAQLSVSGVFTEIEDNSIYLLNTLVSAKICIQQQHNQITELTTYDNSFLTQSQYGISEMAFYNYNPTNLSTMSNTAGVDKITVWYSNIDKVPDWIDHFPNIYIIDLSYNNLASVGYLTFNDLPQVKVI